MWLGVGYERFFHPPGEFVPQPPVVGKFIVARPWFGRTHRVIDQMSCFREMIACSPGIFTEDNNCIILPVGQFGQVFCVHTGTVAACFFQDAKDTGGDGTPCYPCGKDFPVGMKHPADAFSNLGTDGVVGAEEEDGRHRDLWFAVQDNNSWEGTRKRYRLSNSAR